MTDDIEAIDYWELGFNLFNKEPELIMATVWRRADQLTKTQEHQFNFVFGYTAARKQHDDYRREHHGHDAGS